MSIKSTISAYVPIALALVCVLSVPDTMSAGEAKMYAANTWLSPCNIGFSDVDDWSNLCDAWYDAVTLCPCFDRDGRQVDGTIRDGKFCDDGEVSWGEDHTYLDDADAAIICTHGMTYSNRWRGLMRYDPTGGENCYAWQYHMSFGNDDLEFLFLSSCHSLDESYLANDRWGHSFDRLHLLTGFHGEMHIGQPDGWNWPDYEDFAEDSLNGPIVDAWIDNLYRDWGNDEDCPVVYVEGNNQSDAQNRLDTERLLMKTPFSDPTGGVFEFEGILDCDPAGEPPFDP